MDKWVDKADVTHTHTHTHTQEYYSTIKNNDTMPFAATWMELEIVILSEASQTKTNIYHLYVEEKDTNELIYKTEIVPQK